MDSDLKDKPINRKSGRRPLSHKGLFGKLSSNSFLDLALLNATGAYPHPTGTALGQGNTDTLEVGMPALNRDVMGVGDLVSFLVTLVANTTGSCH